MGLRNAVVKGIRVVNNILEELTAAKNALYESGSRVQGGVATATGAHSPDDSTDICPEDVLYSTELEDMCEQDPSTWESLASQRWQGHSRVVGEIVDSTTGEVFDTVKVKAGCDEEIGFMS